MSSSRPTTEYINTGRSKLSGVTGLFLVDLVARPVLLVVIAGSWRIIHISYPASQSEVSSAPFRPHYKVGRRSEEKYYIPAMTLNIISTSTILKSAVNTRNAWDGM